MPIAALAAALILPAAASGQVVFNRILLNGEALTNGGAWNVTTSTQVSPSGEYAALTGQINGSAAVAVGTVHPAGFRRVAAAGGGGTPVPGAPPVVHFLSFEEVFVDDHGIVLMRATLSGALGPGLFADDRGSLTTIARTGEPVPASAGLGAGVVFASVGANADGVSFSNGRALFLATLSGGSVTLSDDLSIWLYNAADASLRMVAREGTRWAALGQPLIDSAGNVAFYGDLIANTSTTDGLLVWGDPDALEPFAGEAQPAPGTTTTFLSNDFPDCRSYVLGGLTLNSRGEVAFKAALGAVPQDGLWRRGPGSGAPVFKIARAGDPVPGIASPNPLMGVPNTPRLGGGDGAAAAGAIAWRTVLTGSAVNSTNDAVLLRYIGAGSPGTPELVAREGNPAPDEPSGIIQNGHPTAYAMNRSGQMFISASIIGGPLPGPVTSWCGAEPGSPMHKICRAGDPAFVAGVPGVSTATIASAQIASSVINGPQSGRPSAISDAGAHDGRGLAVMQMSFTPTGGGLTQGIFWVSLAPERAGACCRGSTCVLAAGSACAAGPAQRFAGPGTVCNSPGNLTTPCCLADFNASGALTVQDIFDFLAAYFSADPRADITAAGGLSVQDIFDFLAAYFAGGC